MAFFSQFAMNAEAESFSGVNTVVKRVNAFNIQGFNLDMDTSPRDKMDFRTTIFRNNKNLGTVPYKQIPNEH